ncbi:MAG: hypothetical protein AAFX50_14165 [Acidobacteriota bacterium]
MAATREHDGAAAPDGVKSIAGGAPGPRRRRFRRSQHFGLAVVLVTIAASLHLGFSGKRDLYPFFSWSLFTHVPNVKHDFGLLITGIDGQRLDPPRELNAFSGRLAGAGSIRAYYTVQDFGRAILLRDRETADELRSLLEREYLKGAGGELHYLLVARSYDPIEKWRHGRMEQRPVVELKRDPSP